MLLTWSRLRSLRATLSSLHQRQIKQWKTSQVSKENEEYPRITVPQKMVENLAKHNLRIAKEKGRQERLKLTDKDLLIKCKRAEFNFYRGQKYKMFDPKQLASYGWKHRNCPSDFFTIIAHGKSPSTMFGEERTGFERFKLDTKVLMFLEQEGIKDPTNIQSVMIPAMSTRDHIACASETGSGKTYAYLLPCVQSILKESGNATCIDNDDAIQKTNSPSVIIILPTMELARQVKDVCDRISSCVPVESMVLHGRGESLRHLYGQNGLPMDILIATPGILKRVMDKGVISIRQLRTLVLDEADSLLDDSFSSIITSIFQKSEIDTSIAVQVVLVSATFPRDIDTILGDYLSESSFRKITTDHLHKISPHVTHKFLKMKSADKLENILQLVKGRKQKTVMVFCNNSDTCHWLTQTLRETGINCESLTSYNDPMERIQIYRSFVDSEYNVLICTDIASRGLDTTSVSHVINFDFPSFISDYLHRAGRVGRVNSSNTGQVTSFIVHPYDVDLVWKIEVAVRQGKPVHNVNANIKRKLRGRLEERQGVIEDS